MSLLRYSPVQSAVRCGCGAEYEVSPSRDEDGQPDEQIPGARKCAECGESGCRSCLIECGCSAVLHMECGSEYSGERCCKACLALLRADDSEVNAYAGTITALVLLLCAVALVLMPR